VQQTESIHQRERRKPVASPQAACNYEEVCVVRSPARGHAAQGGSAILQYRAARLGGSIPHWPLELEMDSFLTDRQARGLNERTVQFYGCELATWCDWLRGQGVLKVCDITPHPLRRWLLHLAQRRNPGGVHANYGSIRAFLRWLWEESDIDLPNLISKVEPPKVPETPLRPVPLADLKAVLATCDRRRFTGCRDRALLLALLDTGCRAMEFLSLDLGGVDLAVGTVVIRHGKGRKHRVTFLGAKSRRALRRYLRYRAEPSADEPLWVTIRNSRLTYGGLRSIMRRRAKLAGVATPSIHSFRRAFAITSLRNGVDVFSLQRLLGHADLSVLRRYLKQTQEDLRSVHERHGPVDHAL
jgi:integrase/recombinase XerD